MSSSFFQDNFSYDKLNRLTSISEKLNGTGNDTFKQSYTFDRWGNRTIDQVNTTANVPHPQYTANASNNRLNAPSGYDPLLYDNAGNLTKDSTSQNPTTVMLYDAENRLLSPQTCFPQEGEEVICDVAAATYNYVYDGDGRRVRRTHIGTYNGGVTTWDETWQVYGMDGELLAEYPQYGPSVALAQPQKEYGYRNGQLLVTAEPWENVALRRPATQIDTFENGTRTADRAVNGDANGGFNTGSVAATTNANPHSWWQVDLQSVKAIDSITVWGRSDCCHEMTSDFYVLVSDTPFTSYDLDTTLSQSGVYSYRYFDFAGPASIPVNRTGRYVRVQLAGTQYLVLGEVQVWSAAAKVNWLVTDHLGTPRMIVDKTGAAAGISRHDYLPFGEEVPSNHRNGIPGYGGSDTVRQKFTQKERDNETGLDYFGARYYSSVQGRFTGVDMAGPDLLNPQTLNKYQYCLNNPLRHIDRNGLYEEDVHRDLTYALALAAGFNTMSAKAIAGADQWTDDNPSTSPMGMTPWGDNVTKRELYHFTTAGRRTQMWRAFSESGSLQDLGTFEHAQQDSFSHADYGPTWGHFPSHAPDKTYNDPEKADRMAEVTFDTMKKALGILRYKGKETISYHSVNWKTISPLVQTFNRARTPEEKQKIINQIVQTVQYEHYRQEMERFKKKNIEAQDELQGRVRK